MDDLQAADHVAGSEGQVGDERGDPERPEKEAHHPPPLGRSLTPGEDRGVQFVDRDPGPGQTSQLGGVPHVVRMPVGQDDVPDLVRMMAQASERGEHSARAARNAGVDEDHTVISLDEVGVADPQPLDSFDAVCDPHVEQYRRGCAGA